MDDVVKAFWASAKAVSLSASERQRARDALIVRASTETFTEFAASMKEVLLTEEERSASKEHLIEFMRTYSPAARRSWSMHLFYGRKILAGLTASLVLVGAGSGAAYAAEDTVPGDLLYPVKIHFNEPFQERLRTDPRDQAQWIERRIERRLEEAETLLKRDGVPESAFEELQRRVEEQSSRLREHIDSLPEGAPEEIKTRMQERFEKHESFLTALQNGEVSETDLVRVREHHKRMRAFKDRQGFFFPPPPGGRPPFKFDDRGSGSTIASASGDVIDAFSEDIAVSGRGRPFARPFNASGSVASASGAIGGFPRGVPFDDDRDFGRGPRPTEFDHRFDESDAEDSALERGPMFDDDRPQKGRPPMMLRGDERPFPFERSSVPLPFERLGPPAHSNGDGPRDDDARPETLEERRDSDDRDEDDFEGREEANEREEQEPSESSVDNEIEDLIPDIGL